MIYLIAVGFGLFSLARLNIDLYPKLEFPIIALISQYTGVGPFDMETVVTRPVEETVAAVQNVEKVTSTSAQGLSLVMLEFDWGTDMDQAEIDVRNSLEFIQDILPEEVSGPLVFAFDPSQQPILYLALSSDLHGQSELRQIAEHDLEPRLERIPGVASAFTMGGMRREIKVLVDPARLRAHHLSMQHVSTALQTGNLQLPAGKIDNPRLEFTLQAAGEFSSIEEIENTSVAAWNGTAIRMKDIATVVDGFAEQQQKVWNNGQPAVMVMVMKQSDANTLNVCREVRERFPRLAAELPQGVRINTVVDFSEFINKSISNLGSNALQAIALTFLVLLFFLRNMRSSLIVAASIPISMIVTFAVMDQAGLTLNIISMAGLALAVGMLVDNSIVVLESIFRHRESGEELRTAAQDGTTEVSMAITASTLTTLAVFVPVLFVPGLAGEMFNDMVVTICFSLTVSLLVALTLIPLFASRLLVLKEKLHHGGVWERVGARIGKSLVRMHQIHAGALQWSLHHRKTVVYSNLGIFILSVIILANLGGEFLPRSDSGFVAVAVDRAPGTSLEAMETSMREIDEIIRANVPEAKNTYINFGQGESIMAFFSSRASSEGDVTLGLTNLSKRRRTQFDIEDDLREHFKNLPGLDVRFADRGQEAMFGGGGDIAVEIFGHDLTRAEALANAILGKVKNIRGVADVETSLREAVPELKINFDRNRIADLGLSTAQISEIIRTSVLGSVVTQYRDLGDEYDVRVQLVEEARRSKEDIDNILIVTPAGKQIPLRAVAEVEYSKAPIEINREGQERMVSVNIDISGRDLRGVTGDVQQALQQVTVPNDFRVEIGGVAEEQQESFMYLGLAMLAALALVYMVMASQFESLLDPFVILFTIPLSSIGVALALLLTGSNLNVMALIGLIMLVGIVVNNGIVLVDYTNQLRARGKPLFEAIMEAGRVRMRPVLMTALTTIFGMLPLALGLGESGENWAPMARTVMGGLTAATALTLVVVPVIYAIVEMKVEAIRQKRAAQKGPVIAAATT
jgi:HAE1 family hydrophobic/amphiphilic exporter-1